MFKKILIANRGEIALRIIRACRELGIKTVAIHSVPDQDSLHVKLADESVCIGPAESKSSYLNVPNIISAAEITDADAIHPGYGFLTEDASFAEICEKCNLKFIGPTAEAMRLMGNKALAREVAQRASVPTLPGSDGVVRNPAEALQWARNIGFPVAIKASGGGGGKGIKVLTAEDNLETAFLMAQSEAFAAFGNSDLYVEKFLSKARHVEIQILADASGKILHLGERDCSVQRRHQKLVEESPSPGLSAATRLKMGQAAIKAARAVGYINAGTVEFLLDDGGYFYFIEMNTRIQVEHPVTEMITGIDLVKEQIRIAMGEKLAFSQKDVKFRGHSIECRVNAEDPDSFVPSPGLISAISFPGGPGVRIDSAIYPQIKITPHYDSLLAKLIVHGADRPEALARMGRALDEMQIEGVKTNIPLLKKIISSPKFVQGDYRTNFIEKNI